MSARPPEPKELPYANKGDLINGPVRDHLIRLAIPMVWSMLAVICVQLTDTFFVAMLGQKALTGMSFTFPVTMLISQLVFGINIAMSSVISRLIGAGAGEDAKRVAIHGITLAFAVSVVISFITYIFLDPIFHLLGADAASLGVVHQYMPMWLAASAVLAIPINANSAVRATGDTFSPSFVMLGLAVINLILAPIFVFGLLGFPRLEIFGAASATFTATIFSVFFGLYVLVVKKKFIPHDGLHLDKVKDSLKRLAVIAVPAGIANVITPVTASVFTAILARQGGAAVAAFGVASRVEALAMIALIALAIGMSPLVGQNWGAKKYGRVHETIKLAIEWNFIWSLFMAVLFGIFAYPIARAFSDDPETVRLAVLYFRVIPISYGFGNLTFGWCAAFNSMGAPQRSFAMIAVKSFLMAIPGAVIGGALYGAGGVFLGIAVSNIISGALFQVLSWRLTKNDEARALAAA